MQRDPTKVESRKIQRLREGDDFSKMDDSKYEEEDKDYEEAGNGVVDIEDDMEAGDDAEAF